MHVLSYFEIWSYELIAVIFRTITSEIIICRIVTGKILKHYKIKKIMKLQKKEKRKKREKKKMVKNGYLDCLGGVRLC